MGRFLERAILTTHGLLRKSEIHMVIRCYHSVLRDIYGAMTDTFFGLLVCNPFLPSSSPRKYANALSLDVYIDPNQTINMKREVREYPYSTSFRFLC